MSNDKNSTLLDRNEAEGLKLKHIKTKAELDEVEQANIQSGLQWLNRTKRKDLLSEKFIRDLHKQLLGEVWE
ncbi:MAG: hypothetical protein KDD56_07420 [Bdellovibrionales bacterium]|nr:hypothetical protein [Bdellovibrionales bacterium]